MKMEFFFLMKQLCLNYTKKLIIILKSVDFSKNASTYNSIWHCLNQYLVFFSNFKEHTFILLFILTHIYNCKKNIFKFCRSTAIYQIKYWYFLVKKLIYLKRSKFRPFLNSEKKWYREEFLGREIPGPERWTLIS